MQLPRIVVNVKAFPEVLGRGAGFLEGLANEAVQRGHRVGVALPATELRGAQVEGIDLFAQHVDAVMPGPATGWLPVEAIQAAGARGSLLNHAEHKVPRAAAAQTVSRLREAGLWSALCADGDAEVRSLAMLRPTYVAVEPPELIGGQQSVTNADPAIVERAAAIVRGEAPETKLLCGAGIKTGADLAKALDLGAYGVLLASGIVKAENPAAALADLLRFVP
ncbi:MAG: triose-phosphate isomerase [Thermoplasmatota archaeon]